MGSQIAKCRFAPFCPSGGILAGMPRKIRFYSLRSYAYFVELTSSFFLDMVVSGVAR